MVLRKIEERKEIAMNNDCETQDFLKKQNVLQHL